MRLSPRYVPRVLVPALLALELLAVSAAAGGGVPFHSPRRSAAEAVAAGDGRGIYVGCNGITNEAPASLWTALHTPGVDGLQIVIGWNEIEPAMGSFQWDSLDLWVDAAAAAGRKVSLSVTDGLQTPPWLFLPPPQGAGAQRLAFSFQRKSSTFCLRDSIAPPWDHAFEARWDSMLTHLAAHLQDTHRYDEVVRLRLTGIDMDSDELHLPSAATDANSLPCETNAVTTWQQAGYRPSLLLQGWDSLTTSFQRHFPDKLFSVAIIAITYPFPPIDERDSVFAVTDRESLSVAENRPLLALASAKFPGRLVIQNNTLYVTELAQAQTVGASQSLGTMIAFQTNEDLPPSTDKHATCGARGDTTPCDSLDYLEMLKTGIYPLGAGNALRAQYLEVFAADVDSFPGAIQAAHDLLLGLAQVGVEPPRAGAPAYDLAHGHPNPFRAGTTIDYSIGGQDHVRLTVYDALGRRVATLVDRVMGPGRYHAVWDGVGPRDRRVAGGVYFVRLQAGAYDSVRKLTLVP